MTTDLDALEALAKAATPGPRFPDSTAAAMGMNEGERATVFDAEFIAAADPPTVLALIAELRQERERAEKRVGGRELARLRTALSRAEEIIEEAKESARIGNDQQDMDAIFMLLTEYDKQKGRVHD